VCYFCIYWLLYIVIVLTVSLGKQRMTAFVTVIPKGVETPVFLIIFGGTWLSQMLVDCMVQNLPLLGPTMAVAYRS